jgi:hypothetical protein
MVDSAESMLSKNKLGKTQARAKGIMGITKDKLFGAIADLVEMLVEYGCEEESIIHILTYYGFTNEQIAEWYGITGA